MDVINNFVRHYFQQFRQFQPRAFDRICPQVSPIQNAAQLLNKHRFSMGKNCDF